MQFKNLPLTKIVWLVASVGLVLAMLFALNDMRNNLSKSLEMDRSAELVSFSITVSDLVHEQQKERGTSAVFLTNNGQTFRPEMLAQRKQTDAKRLIVEESIASLRDSGKADEIVGSLQAFEERLAGIEAMRARIDDLDVSRAEQVQFYTGVNHTAISLVGNITAGVSDPEVAKGILVYSALLYGKDTAGIARAIGASGFARGSFDQGLAARLVSLTASQDAYFDYVMELATDPQRKALEAMLASETSQEIEAMSDIALSGDSAAIATITASDWFDAKTAKLGDLKRLEDTMAGDLKEAILANAARANNAVLVASFLLLLGFAAAVAMCFVFVRAIQRRISSVVAPLDELSRGKLNVEIPDHSRTEFSVITEAMRVFKKNAIARHEEDKQREYVVSVLRDRLSAMANGDLENPIDSDFADDFRSIRTDFNDAQMELNKVIRAVVASSEGIRHSADEVKGAASDLSERTVRQATTLEETAAALKKTTSGIQESARKAQDTNLQVAKARECASTNGEIVESAVEAMELIQSSFAEVEQITNMIRDIAFQTNILALNAGVEATRAGEAGKGFGVVATEVRALAQRSSEAVTDIQELMTTSAEKIEHGSQQVAASGAALREMIGMIDKVSQNVSELADASTEHSEGLHEVNGAVSELDLATQQNAAMAEQSSAASAQLAQEAQNLNQKTAVFTQHSSAASSHSEDYEVEFRLSA